MSVRNSLLALLAERPAHGYSLKSNFEKSTAGAWPLNVGQVYSTLGRLERDGLVTTSGSAAERSRQAWKITKAGRSTLNNWFHATVVERPRDELAMKLLLAVAAEPEEVQPILQSQRAATMAALQELTREKMAVDPQGDLAWLLLLDRLILKAEAEIKWLDLCDERLRHRAARQKS